jgi:hypothetical protein
MLLHNLKKTLLLVLFTLTLLACKNEEVAPVVVEAPSIGSLLINVLGTEANNFSYDLYSELSYSARLEGNIMPELLSGKVTNNRILLNDLNTGNYVIVIYRPSQGSHYGIQVVAGKIKEYTF